MHGTPARRQVRTRRGHKLAECLWWVFVLADMPDVDMPEAYAAMMDGIGAGLKRTLHGMDA